MLDTPQVHPCRLVDGRPWPSTVQHEGYPAPR